MAKHQTKINASVLHKKMQQRWLYLDEHNLSGGSYQLEVELLESLLGAQLTDAGSSPAMDGALLLRHFAKRKAAKEEQKTGGRYHQFVEPFLASLEFIVHEEKLSRVDF